MFRSITIAFLLCLLLGSECFAQGLLGKGHVSSQFLLFDTNLTNGFRFDNYSTGWQTQINAPIIWLENEEPFSGVAMDIFATLHGVTMASQNDFGDTNHADSIGGDLGFNMFFHATEHFRPFATAGMLWNSTELDSVTLARPAAPPDPPIPETTATTPITTRKTFFGFGAEVDLIDLVALRSSFVFQVDPQIDHDIVNELFIRPSQSWFVRLSLVIDTAGNKTGGIGAGLTW